MPTTWLLSGKTGAVRRPTGGKGQPLDMPQGLPAEPQSRWIIRGVAICRIIAACRQFATGPWPRGAPLWRQ